MPWRAIVKETGRVLRSQPVLWGVVLLYGLWKAATVSVGGSWPVPPSGEWTFTSWAFSMAVTLGLGFTTAVARAAVVRSAVADEPASAGPVLRFLRLWWPSVLLLVVLETAFMAIMGLIVIAPIVGVGLVGLTQIGDFAMFLFFVWWLVIVVLMIAGGLWLTTAYQACFQEPLPVQHALRAGWNVLSQRTGALLGVVVGVGGLLWLLAWGLTFVSGAVLVGTSEPWTMLREAARWPWSLRLLNGMATALASVVYWTFFTRAWPFLRTALIPATAGSPRP